MSWNQPALAIPEASDVRVTAFLSKVYGWMFLGLGITAVTAFAVASSPALIEAVFLNRLVFWALIIAQLGLVFFLSARVDKVAPTTAANGKMTSACPISRRISASSRTSPRTKSKFSSG